jgi:RNA polymerase sigma factor (TIGR02999 family)
VTSGIERITAMLVAHREAEPGALDRLTELVYPELRRIARVQLRRWRPGDRPDTGSVVHQAYLKLVDQSKVDWQDRHHFYAVAAHAMRHVIIDYARRRLSQKRGGGAHHMNLETHEVAVAQQAETLLALDKVLGDLERHDPRLAQVVDCRFFAGYSEEETATILAVSIRTVQRDWRRAKAWLRQAMERDAARP